MVTTQPIPDNFYRTSIKALILDEGGRFLLTKEDNGTWELPGGGLDFGETPQDSLRRESREEMGLTVTFVADQPSYFLTAQNGKGTWIANVIYETRVQDLNFTPSDECVEVRFFTPDEALKENIFPSVAIFARMCAGQQRAAS